MISGWVRKIVKNEFVTLATGIALVTEKLSELYVMHEKVANACLENRQIINMMAEMHSSMMQEVSKQINEDNLKTSLMPIDTSDKDFIN